MSFVRTDHRYAPLDEGGTKKSPRSPRRVDSVPVGVPLHSNASAAKLITCQVLTDVVDKGDSILQAKRGEIAFVTKEDWDEGGEWVFGKVGLQSGYLPRSYLHKKN